MKRGKTSRERGVRIQSGVNVLQRAYKARGGLIRALLVEREGRIADVELSGDFFFYPADRLADLERALAGRLLSEVESVVAEFYAAHAIQSPGVAPADFAELLRIPV